MKAFAYLRVSSKGQVSGDGFPRQEEAVTSFCGDVGIEVAGVYREDFTGTAEERPVFQEMVTDILRNGVRAVVVERLDRLARAYRVQETLLIYLASKGIEVYSAATGENVTQEIMADPMRKALVQVQGVFAELEKSLLVKKLRLARERKKSASGKCEGRKGYGDTEAGLVLMDLIRGLRAEKASHSEIATLLNESGKLTLDGKPFTEKNVAMIWRRNRGVRS